jgi:hypothetical protein
MGWTKAVHDVYGTLGTGLLWPFRWARSKLSGGGPDPAQAYLQAERDVMLLAIDKLYAELTRLSQLGNDLLRPRLEALLSGASRADLLDRLSKEQQALDLDDELGRVVGAQMQIFRDENPHAFGMFRKLDSAAAVARPVTSVVSFAYGGVVGHGLIAHGVQSLAIYMGDIATGTAVVVGSETVLTSTASGLRLLEARFRQLQSAFTTRRVAWFAEFLHQHILGSLQRELTTAAGVTQTPDFSAAEGTLARLGQMLRA